MRQHTLRRWYDKSTRSRTCSEIPQSLNKCPLSPPCLTAQYNVREVMDCDAAASLRNNQVGGGLANPQQRASSPMRCSGRTNWRSAGSEACASVIETAAMASRISHTCASRCPQFPGATRRFRGTHLSRRVWLHLPAQVCEMRARIHCPGASHPNLWSQACSTTSNSVSATSLSARPSI